jgi:hypothetical protein
MKNKLTESKEQLQATIFENKKLLLKSQIELKIIGNLTNTLVANNFEFFKKHNQQIFISLKKKMLSFSAWETELNK